jgi:hypothetical protein
MVCHSEAVFNAFYVVYVFYAFYVVYEFYVFYAFYVCVVGLFKVSTIGGPLLNKENQCVI